MENLGMGYQYSQMEVLTGSMLDGFDQIQMPDGISSVRAKTTCACPIRLVFTLTGDESVVPLKTSHVQITGNAHPTSLSDRWKTITSEAWARQNEMKKRSFPITNKEFEPNVNAA